jgi:tetratricopeptide (TPR) repeat protein
MRPHDDSDVWSWKGEAHLALGNLDKGSTIFLVFLLIYVALECFDKALEINPKDALSMHGKGEVYDKKGDKKASEEWLTKALNTDRLYHKSDYFRQKVPLVPVA